MRALLFANNQCSLACSRLSVRRDGTKKLEAGLKKKKNKKKKTREEKDEWSGVDFAQSNYMRFMHAGQE